MEQTQALRQLQKKRTSNFREDETKALIELWGSPQIQKKLYLTHRKAPVMRMIAANMQQRGFYRTPDEIKTRIRNLKCLYHRIKRTMHKGSGLGIVDPDWPHYKAMDEILNKPNLVKHETIYPETILEGPRCEDIKLEIDDIDLNDDVDSYTTNSYADSDYEDDQSQMPPLTPAPPPPSQKKDDKKPLTAMQILPKSTLITSSPASRPTTTQSLPFPLLILKGLPQQKPLSNDKTLPLTSSPAPRIQVKPSTQTSNNVLLQPDISNILKGILDVQKDNLELAKQRLELDKQKLDFERLVGTQLLTLLPMMGGLLQRLSAPSEAKPNRKRPHDSTNTTDLFKDSKILRNVLEQGIRKYMLGEDDDEEEEEDNNSENEDSGVQNDDNSNASK